MLDKIESASKPWIAPSQVAVRALCHVVRQRIGLDEPLPEDLRRLVSMVHLIVAATARGDRIFHIFQGKNENGTTRSHFFEVDGEVTDASQAQAMILSLKASIEVLKRTFLRASPPPAGDVDLVSLLPRRPSLIENLPPSAEDVQVVIRQQPRKVLS
jgi:hypothetical protein